MGRYIDAPTPALKQMNIVVPLSKGGTEANTDSLAVVKLGGIHLSEVNQPNGAVSIGADGKIPVGLFPSNIQKRAKISGVGTLYAGQQGQFIITNYDAFTTYTLSNSYGTLTRVENIIYYTAPVTLPPNGIGGFTINGRAISINILPSFVNQPSIISSTTQNGGFSRDATLYSSGFSTSGVSDSHLSSDWQLSLVSNFSSLVTQSVNNTTNKTAWPLTNLLEGTTYYARVRYKGSLLGYSAWSPTFSFTTFDRNLPINEQAVLSPTDLGNGDSFGYKVAISADGKYVIVGAYMADPYGVSDGGKAYIFSWNGSSWVQNTLTNGGIITPDDRAISDGFGFAVDIDANGTRVAIGAPFDKNQGYANSGSIYVYARSGATAWYLESKLLPTPIDNNNRFGFSVAISANGDRIVGGEPYLSVNNNSVQWCGGVRIFARYSGATWSLESSYRMSDRKSYDRAGNSVAIDASGSRVIVGAYRARNGSTYAQGAVYVLARSGATWYEEAKVTLPWTSAGACFGWSVAVSSSGDRFICSGRINGTSISNGDAGWDVYNAPGEVFIYRRTGTTWYQEGYIASPTNGWDGKFGYSVSMNALGDKVAIGLPNASTRGEVYIYKWTGSAWVYEEKVTGSINNAYNRFGVSVDLNSDYSRMVVGSDYTNYMGTGKGFIFSS